VAQIISEGPMLDGNFSTGLGLCVKNGNRIAVLTVNVLSAPSHFWGWTL
jgi:hypothetical protein